MDAAGIEAVFSELDDLYANRETVKTQSKDDRDTLEVPFHLKLEGQSGRLRVELDPSGDGIGLRPDKIPGHYASVPSVAPPPLSPMPWIQRSILRPETFLPLESLQTISSPYVASPAPPITPTSVSDSVFRVPPFSAYRIEGVTPAVRVRLRRGGDGRAVGWEEEVVSGELGDVTRSNSKKFIRGSTNNRSFRPGGFTDDEKKADAKNSENLSFREDFAFLDLSEKELADENKTLRRLPGFEGANFLGIENPSLTRSNKDRKGVYRSFVNRKGLIDGQLEIDQEEQGTAESLRYIQQKRQNRAQNHLDEEMAELEADRKIAEANAKKISKNFAPMRRQAPTMLNELTKLRNFGGGRSASGNGNRGGVGEFTIDDVLAIEGLDDDKVGSILQRAGGLKVDQKKESKAKSADERTWAVMSRIPVEDFHSQVPDMAIKYPFELDRFQKEAILHVENSECVFVAAHTSAGKTVVAEYAIALSCRHMTRAVYTSPIKTLSNQKFREFRKTFGEADVGLITGDVSINPDGTCLILTTEILRSMLYRGADLIRDIEWVIFDEVHYINDRERGVVWEEVIMMLPDHVSIVMLSATVPNTFEFADWVGRTKKKPVYVVSTYKRPVPLQHYLWCHNKMFKILDADGNFRTEGFRQARLEGKKLERDSKKHGQSGAGRGRWFKLVQYLMKLSLLPLVVFSFSKKLCEELSYTLSGLDLNDHKDKGLVYGFVDRSVKRLQEVDRRLPQVRRVRSLAARGIGVHHAGMLPLLKEVVEMLFSRGLIKVLFATETFAMGVNMPTRTVVFNGTRKHDGTQFRDLLPSEYTQMAGRAGRRGLDSFGVVVVFCRNDEVPAENGARQLLTGKATRLQSRFRLTFNMLLNLLRQEDLTVRDFVRRSFAEAPARRAAPRQRLALASASEYLEALPLAACQGAKEYLAARERVESFMQKEVSAILRSQALASRILGPGRVIICSLPLLLPETRDIPVPAVVLRTGGGAREAFRGGGSMYILVLHPEISPKDAKNTKKQTESLLSEGGVLRQGVTKLGRSWSIAAARAEHIIRICKQRLRIEAESVMKPPRSRSGGGWGGGGDPVGDAVALLINAEKKAKKGGSKVWGGYPGFVEMHPQKDMKIKDLSFIELHRARRHAQASLNDMGCFGCNCESSSRKTNLEKARAAMALERRISRLKSALSDDRVAMLGELDQRVAILQALDYVGPTREVLLKGRVACEIGTCDCLIVTELIFENVLDDLDGPEAVALLSALVFKRRTDVEPQLNGPLTRALKRLNEVALAIGNLLLKNGLDVIPQQFARDSVHDGLMQVTYEWAKGTPFYQICELTDQPEGSIVRCILHLHGALKDVRNAARVIGDPKLYQSMEACAELIKRDIVFAASLYVA